MIESPKSMEMNELQIRKNIHSFIFIKKVINN
jgi:hypothetical protein